MSDHPGRITPDEVGQRPAPFADCYIRTLRQLAARTLTGGVAGLKGSDYAGQGYVEVPSAWLAEILDRLAAAEAAIGVSAVINAQAPLRPSLDPEETALFDDASKHMDAFLEESRRSASHNPASAYQAVRARLAEHPRVLEALSARFAVSVAASDYLSRAGTPVMPIHPIPDGLSAFERGQLRARAFEYLADVTPGTPLHNRFAHSSFTKAVELLAAWYAAPDGTQPPAFMVNSTVAVDEGGPYLVFATRGYWSGSTPGSLPDNLL